MNLEESIRRTIAGNQRSSLEYMKYFSMCDCLTLNMKNTYTAHEACLNVFNKKFKPGNIWIVPWVNKFNENQLKSIRPIGYKIPKKIDVFLWSPFHESTAKYYDVGDNILYACRQRGEALRKYNIGSFVRRPNLTDLLSNLTIMNKKITRFWGKDIIKLIILYNTDRITDEKEYSRVKRFEETSLRYLNWPFLRIKLTKNDLASEKEAKEKNLSWNGWQHYCQETRNIFYNEIEDFVIKRRKTDGLVE